MCIGFCVFSVYMKICLRYSYRFEKCPRSVNNSRTNFFCDFLWFGGIWGVLNGPTPAPSPASMPHFVCPHFSTEFWILKTPCGVTPPPPSTFGGSAFSRFVGACGGLAVYAWWSFGWSCLILADLGRYTRGDARILRKNLPNLAKPMPKTMQQIMPNKNRKLETRRM